MVAEHVAKRVTVHGPVERVSPPPIPPHNVADLSHSGIAGSIAATLRGGGHAPPRERLSKRGRGSTGLAVWGVATAIFACQLAGVPRRGVAAESATTAAAAVERGPDWWKANKGRATFVPDKGFSVEGVPGYFDENGMPIQAQVRATPRGVGHVPSSPLRPIRTASTAEPSVFQRLTTAIGQGSDQSKAKQLVQEAEALLREREFTAAAPKYKHAAASWPDSPLAEKAQFMVAECLFFSDAYPKASDAYTKFLTDYPGSRRLDEVVTRLFAIARYWQEYDNARPHWPITPNLTDKTRRTFDTLGHALKVYEAIRLADPTGPRADDALMATATAYFTHGRYENADYHFGLLRREYPKSEYQFQAHLLGLQCKLRKYQGSDYDGKPLEEAQQLVEQLVTQFPDKIAGERQQITKMRAEVAAQFALRDWNMAEYYVNGKHYTAARYYYRRLAQDHPQTRLAEEARDRLAEFDGQADPPTRLVWLTNLFSASPTQSATGSSIPAIPADTTIRR
jgi:outer membrane protein assembly factor BamD (BamD/ComL family)